MILPEKIKQKYLSRLEDLIEKGKRVPVQTESIVSTNYVTEKRTCHQIEKIDWPMFVEWRTNCVTLLDQIIPKNCAHRPTVDGFSALTNTKGHLEFGISFLKSIKDDFEGGFLENLTLEIETELTADFMGQAENLLIEGTAGKYDHVPAAVLAGAVLEKSLKTMCYQLSPVEPIINDRGAHLKMNALIDSLKKRKVFNELRAKELRTWADIRNNAAHGNFEEFNKNQVEAMISGINSFLMQFLQ